MVKVFDRDTLRATIGAQCREDAVVKVPDQLFVLLEERTQIIDVSAKHLGSQERKRAWQMGESELHAPYTRRTRLETSKPPNGVVAQYQLGDAAAGVRALHQISRVLCR